MRHVAIAAALIGTVLSAPAAADELSDAVAADTPYLLDLYKHLHANPEVSGQEIETAARMASELNALGFRVTEQVGGTGVVGVMANGNGPTVMIRADMDGLPVTEETGLPYASKRTVTVKSGGTSGVMHACGHDIHMSSWVGTARYLSGNRDAWSGTLVMIAQPAEETGLGAKAMLDDGLYERFPRPDHAIALHDAAQLPAGQIAMVPGFAMANVDSVDIVVHGEGGHGAYPHTTKDPIVVAARIVGSLQTLVSRETNPQDPAVVTVGAFNAGTKHNIIPNEARLQITVRSYTDAVREHLLTGIRRIAAAEAQAAGIPEDKMPDVSWEDIYTPATFNTIEQTEALEDLFRARFGEDRVIRATPVMGGEDFSRYHRADRNVESTLFWVGGARAEAIEAAGGDMTKLPSLHSSKWAPDPAPTITTGVEAMTAAALSLFAGS
ncbi:amidohydrolase [Pacificimonas sp. WHA3]|uniref:Amidohydrolase n=1 Tax=Pacificimonas pallii TaxID=2827236 RepID=A0ABS6SDN3_9SPHN|nr:amidohydrolase [Pacificimonas pallii]MBV7256021.1 amidohydrolase [Pacificimonas pallii]